MILIIDLLQHLKNCCTLEDLQKPSNLFVQFSHIAVEGVVVGEGVLNRLYQEQHPTACVHAKMNNTRPRVDPRVLQFLLYRSPTLWSRRPGIAQKVFCTQCTVTLLRCGSLMHLANSQFVSTQIVGSHSAAACYCSLTLRPARHCTVGDTPS